MIYRGRPSRRGQIRRAVARRSAAPYGSGGRRRPVLLIPPLRLPPSQPGVRYEQHDDGDREEKVRVQDGADILRRIVVVDDHLVDVAISVTYQLDRRGDHRGEPEAATDPDAEHTENAHGQVAHRVFELKGTPRRPADQPRGEVWEE